MTTIPCHDFLETEREEEKDGRFFREKKMLDEEKEEMEIWIKRYGGKKNVSKSWCWMMKNEGRQKRRDESER